jgi:hypothetical protein
VGQASLAEAELGFTTPSPMGIPSLDPKFFSKFKRWKEEVPNVPPNFQNRLQHTTSQQPINKKFPQRRIKPTVSSPFERLLWITLLCVRSLNNWGGNIGSLRTSCFIGKIHHLKYAGGMTIIAS